MRWNKNRRKRETEREGWRKKEGRRRKRNERLNRKWIARKREKDVDN
jgi:hypothetical protein